MSNENETPPSRRPFRDPYADSDRIPINSNVGKNDYRFIQSIRPASGTITTTFNLLLQALANELRLRSITSFEQSDDYEDLLNNGLRLVPTAEYDALVADSTKLSELRAASGRLFDGPLGRPVPAPDAPNVRPRAKRVRAKRAPDEAKLPDVQSDSPRKSTSEGEGSVGTEEGRHE